MYLKDSQEKATMLTTMRPEKMKRSLALSLLSGVSARPLAMDDWMYMPKFPRAIVRSQIAWMRDSGSGL